MTHYVRVRSFTRWVTNYGRDVAVWPRAEGGGREKDLGETLEKLDEEEARQEFVRKGGRITKHYACCL